jgi:hypothetical protein
MELRDVSFVSGLLKIFDEILVNAEANSSALLAFMAKMTILLLIRMRITTQASLRNLSAWLVLLRYFIMRKS